MKGAEMCGYISRWLKETKDIEVEPEDIWNYSPTGELFVVFATWDTMVEEGWEPEEGWSESALAYIAQGKAEREAEGLDEPIATVQFPDDAGELWDGVCDACTEYAALQGPVLLHAFASVGIERGKSAYEMAQDYFADYHEKGHQR
jgi:hypothetical protein